jgi:hypothetical protein
MAAASGHTLKRRPKLRRAERGVSRAKPDDSREDPKSQERLEGEGRSPTKALPTVAPML